MSLERAIEIFTNQGFSNPQGAVDIIQKAQSLDELKQAMIDNKTCLSANQFVNFRITGLFEGDSDFARQTLDTAKEKFKEYGIPEEIVDCYVSKGGGVDIALGIDAQVYCLHELPMVEDRKKLLSFFNAADDYLFEALRNYVNEK